MSSVTALANSDKLKDVQDKFNDLLTEWQTLEENVKVVAESTPSLSVIVSPGYYCLGDGTYNISYPGETVDLTSSVPGSNSRIVAIALNGLTYPSGPVEVIEGTIAASPVAPDYAGKLVLAEITLTSSTTEITDSMITDVRPFWWATQDSLFIKGKEIDDAAIADGKVLAYISASGKMEYRTVSGLGGISISYIDLTDTPEANYTGKDGYIPTIDEFYSPSVIRLTDPDDISVGQISGNTLNDLDSRYVQQTKNNELATFEDFYRRNVVVNPNFSGWYWVTITPYHKCPIGWIVTGGDGVDVTDGHHGLGMSVPATKDAWQFVDENIVDTWEGQKVWLQGLAKGNGYIRLRITNDSMGTTDYDVPFTNGSAYTELATEVTIPSNAKYLTVYCHSTSGTSIFDHVSLGLQKRNVYDLKPNFIRGKELEFAAFEVYPNSPLESNVGFSPAVTFENDGTNYQGSLYTYSFPENYPGYCDLLLCMLIKPLVGTGGNSRWQIQADFNTGMDHGKTITSQDLTKHCNWAYADTDTKLFGSIIPLSAEPTSEMSMGLQIRRRSENAGDTFEGDVELIAVEIIPIPKVIT